MRYISAVDLIKPGNLTGLFLVPAIKGWGCYLISYTRILHFINKLISRHVC